ncbi:MAG: TrkA C-terminal domain-containing protein, partial [Muribaculaceae bacterium]|nr:TrkA C-terminal domain-containing protein [Muribaculaceae bacterium]
IDNLTERELRRSGKKNAVVHDLHEAFMRVGSGCPFVGERLMDSNLRRRYGVNLVGIQRDSSYIAIPDGRTRLFPGDILTIIGTDEEIEQLLPVVEKELPEATTADPGARRLASILLSPTSPLVNHSPQSTSLRDKYEAIVVAVDRGDEYIDNPSDITFHPGDIVWLVGNPDKISQLK